MNVLKEAELGSASSKTGAGRVLLKDNRSPNKRDDVILGQIIDVQSVV